MINKVKAFIKKNNLILDKPIIVAVSGGADSVSLLDVLHKLGYKLVLAHVNHNKREESKIEQIAMENLAKELNIPFELLDYHYSNSNNFQSEAHFARYDFFKDLCKKYNTNIIATAHHKDDQIETVLMKLMEGSNLYGYGGIAIESKREDYSIVRPLLCVSKDEIYDYCKKNNLVYFEDASNMSNDYLRNRIRHNVIPILKNECANVLDKIMEYSIQAHEAFDYIRSESINYLESNNNQIDYNTYNSLNIALKKDILALLLEKYNIRKNNEIIEKILTILKDSNGTKIINLENNYSFVKNYNKAYIKENNIVNKESYLMNIEDRIKIGNYVFYFTNSHNNKSANYIKLCYNDLEFPLTIRYRENGDEIDLGFGAKKINRILIDKKVPKDIRDSIPVVLDNRGKILWLVNYQKSDFVAKMKEKGDLLLACEVLNDGK